MVANAEEKIDTLLQQLGKTLEAGLSRIHLNPVSYTHLRAHETVLDLVCRLLLETKNTRVLNYNMFIRRNNVLIYSQPRDHNY